MWHGQINPHLLQRVFFVTLCPGTVVVVQISNACFLVILVSVHSFKKKKGYENQQF